MTISVHDVARTFLTFGSMPHKKLQKLCYYAYAWFYTFYGEKLFAGPFEAWIHGPVHNDLYQSYKGYGWASIPKGEQVPDVIAPKYEFIQMIYNTYGEFSGDQLEALTHSEDPWIMARSGLPEYEASRNHIDDELMRSYFRKVLDRGQTE